MRVLFKTLKTSEFVLAAFLVLFTGGASFAGETEKGEIKVTILGSGTPIPSPDQYGSAVLVQAGGKDLLFDCGRGCTSRLAQLDMRLITGLENLFVTHLHSDHIVGMDDLWLNGWVQGRNVPLKVYGPTGTKRFFTHVKKAFREDINVRIKKGIPATTDGIKIDVTELNRGRVVFDEDGVVVTAFLVDHPPLELAFGFRIDYGGRAVLISGDSRPSPNTIKNGAGVDVMIHEVMSPTMTDYIRENFTKEQYDAIVGIHTTAEQAAEIFRQTSPRLVVYYHTRATPRDREDLLRVTKKVFAGDVEVGRDLMQITIGDEITSVMLEK